MLSFFSLWLSNYESWDGFFGNSFTDSYLGGYLLVVAEDWIDEVIKFLEGVGIWMSNVKFIFLIFGG